MVRRRFRRDDQGASALASFMFAVAFFSLSFGTVMLFVAQVGGGQDSADNVERASEVVSVAHLLASTPGSPPTWTAAAPDRLGLLKHGSEATLDLDKVAALRSWTATADYDAARAALGVADRSLFVRTHPVYTAMPGSAVPPGMSDYRVAYVADYASLTENLPSQRESAAIDSLAVNFSNAPVDRTGLGAAGDEFPDTQSTITRHLAPRLAGFAAAIDIDTLAADDNYWKVVNVADYSPGYLAAPTPQVLTVSNYDGARYRYSAFSNNALIAEDTIVLGTFDLRDYADGTAIQLRFSHWASGYRTLVALNPLTDDYGFVSVRCVESCRTGDEVPAARGGLHWQNGTRSAFQSTAVNLSYYRGEKVEISFVWHSILGATSGEGWFLAGPIRLEATVGGVATDLWRNDLDYRLTRYDGLVVGSEVDQSALDDSSGGGIFKTALRDWIAAGGDLFAFGSASATNGWLNPSFTTGSVAQTQGPALLGSSDLSHPLLNVPNRIRPGDLEAAGKAYRASSVFREIIMIEEKNGNGATVPLLAVHAPTQSDSGAVVLTSYLPHTLHETERKNLISNFLLYARYNPLYTDFGPAGGVPYAGAVTSEARTVLIDASEKGLGTVECMLIAYVW